jgi:hypothetical protein
MKRNRTSTEEYPWGTCNSVGTGTSISIRARIDTGNELSYYLINTTVSTGYYITDMSEWHHYATVRYGSELITFVDGVLVHSANIGSGALVDSTTTWSIGRQGEYAGFYFQGYINDFRVSKGIARWTKNFTFPSDPHPNTSDIVSTGNKKIAITPSSDNSQMYVEIEDWNPYTKEAVLWAKVPYISSSEDTKLYLYYDSSQEDNENYIGDIGDAPALKIWEDICLVVWHMNQRPVVNTLKDSTGNAIFGTPSNPSYEDLVDGLIGKAISINSEYIDITENAKFLALKKPYSVQMVVKLNSIIDCVLFSANVTDSASDYSFGIYASDICMGSSSWYYGLDTASNHVNVVDPYLWTVNFTSNTDVDLYLNAQKKTLANIGNAFSGTESSVGGRTSTYQSNAWYDEVRIYYEHRWDAWVKADYYNFNDNLVTFSDSILRPTFVFTGYVKVYGAPAARTVHLYRRSTGEFVGTTTSDLLTGYFEIPGAHEEYHFVVILPELDDGFNLLSYDKINPSV